MIRFTFFIALLSTLLYSCNEQTDETISPSESSSGLLAVKHISVVPDSFYPDTISKSTLTFLVNMEIHSGENVASIATMHLSDPSGYRSNVTFEFQVKPGLSNYSKTFSLPVDTSEVYSPTLSLRIGTISNQSEIVLSPVVKTLNPSTGPPSVDSIRFNPPEKVVRGSVFTMSVWASDPRGSGHLARVTVLGKRPDGSNQTPFNIPRINDGFFSLTNVVLQSSQTGIYEWKFIAVNKNGISSQPVIRTFEVIP